MAEAEEQREILVLMIEDDPDLLEIQRMVLESEGFLVVTARDGQRALRLLDVLRPDVILTDMMMPVLDGFEFIRRYQKRADSGVPIIAISSFDNYVHEAAELGVAAAMRKPIDIDTMTRWIRRLTRGQPAQEVAVAPAAQAEAEVARLQAIIDLNLDRPATEASLTRFIDTVAEYFDVQIALLSIVTEDRQQWSAACGLPEDLARERSTPREQSFCTHAVAARSALVVQDAAENPFFRNNPLVKGRGLRFYAGVPIFARHGEALGTLCLMDSKPRRFTHLDLELLSLLAKRVMAELEWRELRQAHDIPQGSFRYLEFVDSELDIFGRAGFEEVARVEGARGLELGVLMICAVVEVPEGGLSALVDRLQEARTAIIVGRLGRTRLGCVLPNMTPENALDLVGTLAGPGATVQAAALGSTSQGVMATLAELEAGVTPVG